MTRFDPLVAMYCVPLHRQVSERSCRKFPKSHEAHLPQVAQLSEVLVILDEAKHVDKQVTTPGGKLRIKKSKANNQFALSGASFLPYLKTLHYGYILCAMSIVSRPVGLKPVHRREILKCNGLRCVQYSCITTLLRTLLFVTSARYDPPVIAPISLGVQGKDLIIAADLVLRTEMFRINTLHPTLSGDEVLASVLTSA